MNSKTKLCCLIGNPVAHSISPLIHNTLADRMGINMVYTAFCVDNNKVVDAVKGAHALKIQGMNVTVPHKCTVIDSLCDIDPLAEKIGAVNTLVYTDEGYKGYNTDIIGLKRELEEENIEITGQEVIIIGAGGAAKAITYLCAQLKASKIWLMNRTIDKAQSLAKEVNESFGEIAEPLRLDEYNKIPMGKYPVIQTTSAGLYPDCDVAPIEDEEFYERCGAAVDIIFNPSETKFMKKAAAHGAGNCCNGLKMLLYQGIAAFELWNNVTVPSEMAKEVLALMEKEMAK